MTTFDFTVLVDAFPSGAVFTVEDFAENDSCLVLFAGVPFDCLAGVFPFADLVAGWLETVSRPKVNCSASSLPVGSSAGISSSSAILPVSRV